MGVDVRHAYDNMYVSFSTKGLCRSTCQITDRSRVIFRARFYYVLGLYEATSRRLVNNDQDRYTNGASFSLTACFYSKGKYIRFSCIAGRANDNWHAWGTRVAGIATFLGVVGRNERGSTKAANEYNCCFSAKDVFFACHRDVERSRSSKLRKLFVSNNACVVNKNFSSGV